MFALPRGHTANINVPLTSAEWERPEVVERQVYQDNGSIFLGAIPAHDLWPKLKMLRDNAGALNRQIDQSALSAPRRAELVRALENVWMAAQRAEVLPVGYLDDRHVVTIAGARSGKGRACIVPNLCLYPGSVVTIDPKGENASLTAARRGPGSSMCDGMGQAVYVLDPFGVADVPDKLRAGFNPLQLIDLTSDTAIDTAALLAESMVIPSSKEGAHWDESAINYVKGVTLYMMATHEHPTLFTLRRLLTQGERDDWQKLCAKNAEFKKMTPLSLLLERMRVISTGNPALDDIIIGTADTLAQCGENERGSILSSVRRHTAFLDTINPRFRETLAGQGRTFDPDQLKTDPAGVSVYLCLPASRMGSYSRWLRVMVNVVLERLQRSLEAPASKAPVLFVLDESFTLGPMSTLENAAGFSAGYGVKLWTILQDLGQLKTLYPLNWQTFLANAGVVQVFGVSDAETCEYVSKMLGQVETRQTVQGFNTSTQEGFNQRSETDRLAPITGAMSGQRLAAAAAHAATALLTDDLARSGTTSQTHNQNEHITLAPLLRPDEVARQFARETGAALVMTKGQRPWWTLRVNYDESPWFAGRYHPLATHSQHSKRAPDGGAFGERQTGRFVACVEAFNALVRTAGMG
jgi:type IV secretion system protein VirD4